MNGGCITPCPAPFEPRCTPDRHASEECVAITDRLNELETVDCGPLDLCLGGKCESLTDEQASAYQGIGGFSMPCEADCEAATMAGCSDSAAFHASCVAHCASAEASAGACTTALTAVWQCLAVNDQYACTPNNAHQLSRSDAVQGLCADVTAECSRCLGASACAPFFDQWVK